MKIFFLYLYTIWLFNNLLLKCEETADSEITNLSTPFDKRDEVISFDEINNDEQAETPSDNFEDVIIEDPGYEEDSDDDMPVSDTVATETGEDPESLPDDDTKDSMLEGFEGNREPLPFEEELKEEEKFFGKIENEDPSPLDKRSSISNEEGDEDDPEDVKNDLIEDDGIYAEEVDETEDGDDSNQEIDSDNLLNSEKRNFVADSDNDILGTNVDDFDEETEIDKEETKLEDPDIKSVDNSNTMNYVKLLSDLEDEKTTENDSTQRFIKDTIPKPENNINEQRDNIIDESIVEQLTDSDESETLPKSEFEQFMDFNEEKEAEDPKTCSDKKKSRVLEYADSDNSDQPSDLSEFDSKDLVDDPHINFDCANCISIDEEEQPEAKNSIVDSKLSCPNSSPENSENPFARDNIEQMMNQKIFKKTDITQFVKTTDYICNEKCETQKRSVIEKNTLYKLSNIKLWRKLNPDIKYHRVPRSSIGVLLDGNLQMDDYIVNFVLNMFLLFSRDSAMSLGVFRHCLKTVNLPIQSMMNQFSSYYHYLKDVKRLKEDIGLGPEGNRNVHWALGDFSKIILENSKTVDTELKIIILVTNGPFTETQVDDLNLQLIKKQNEENKILVFIVALGSKVDTCQLERTTLSSRIIVVHYLNQLVYGGKAQFRMLSPQDQKDQLISMGGVLSVLQRKFSDSAKLIEPLKGEITYFKGGYVGWSSDTKYKNLIPLQFSIPGSDAASTKLSSDDLSKIGLSDIIKRQSIPRVSQLPRRLRARPPIRARAPLRGLSGGVDLNTLNRQWYWTRMFPAIRKGAVKEANVMILVDVLGLSMINIMQKLTYYTAIPFTYTLGQTSIYGMTSIRLEEYCQKKTFSRSEDIQRLVTTISSGTGKTFSISQHVLQLLKSPRLISLKMSNVMILILTHRTFDFSQYRYVARALQAAGIKLYILGLGLSSERAWYLQLTTSNRIFTSLTVQSFFTNQMFSSFVRQLRMDVGASERVTNLDPVISRASSTLRRINRMSSAIRGRSRSTSTSSRSRSRTSSGRSSSSTSSRRRSRRIIRPRQSSIRRIFRTIRRQRSRRDDVPRIFKRSLSLEDHSDNNNYETIGRSEIEEKESDNEQNDQIDFTVDTKSDIPIDDSETKAEEINEKRNIISRLFRRRPRSRSAKRRPVTSSSKKPSRLSSRRPSRPSVRQPTRPRLSRRPPRRTPQSLNRTIGRNIRMISRMISSDGAVGPINLVVLVDGTFGTDITRIRGFLSDYLLIFQREGSYITLASFASSTHLHSLSTQFANAGQITAAVNRIKGVRLRSRSTGQALMAARRWLSSSVPDYPFVVLAILNGPSADDYRVPASMLAKDGIKVIVIGNGRNVRDDELLSIQSSAKLAFRTNFNNIPRIVTSLLPLFKAICGSRKRKLSSEGKRFMNQLTISKQWSWKSYGSRIRERGIASSEIASILDTTSSPDSIIKMYYNIMNSFSIRSFHSIRLLGLADYSSLLLARFRRYTDQTSTQLILSGLLGNSVKRARVRKIIRRVVRRRARRTKRDLIDDIFKEEANNFSRQKKDVYPNRFGRIRTGTTIQNRITPFGRFRKTGSIPISSSGIRTNGLLYKSVPNRVNQKYIYNEPLFSNAKKRADTITNNYVNAPTKMNYRSKSALTRFGVLKPTNLGKRIVGSTNGLLQTTKRKIPIRQSLSGFSKSSKSSYYGGSMNSSASSISSGSSGRRRMRRILGLRRLRTGSSNRGRAGGSVGNRPGASGGSRPGSSITGRTRQRFRSGRIYLPRYRARTYLRYRRTKICYERSWRCLTLKLYRILKVMKRRNLFTAYGPNKNKIVLLILSGWPTQSGRRLSDSGFRLVARNITQMGVRLMIIVMQTSKTSDRFAQPILRAASTFFAHGSWSESQSILGRFQRTSLKRFGEIEKVSYGLSFSQYNMKKSAGFSVIPKYDGILPPIYESYMTTKYLVTIQNLRLVSEWRQIIPGLRPNYIRGSLNVIVVVDVTEKKFGTVIRDAVTNLLRIFNKRDTTFTLILVSGNSRMVLTNYNANNLRKMRYFASRIRFSVTGLIKPRFGASLNFIKTMVLPKLRPSKRNLIVFFAQSSSVDDLRSSTYALKSLGTIISVFGIGCKINVPELQTLATSGQLLATGQVSMLPLMLFRMEFSLSLVINGPAMTKRDISILSSTKIRPYSTVFRGVKGDTPQTVNPLGRVRLNSSKRDEILADAPKTNPTNQTVIVSSFKAVEQEIIEGSQLSLNATKISPQIPISSNATFITL